MPRKQDVAAVKDAREKVEQHAAQKGRAVDLSGDFIYVQQMRPARANATQA